jgi:hypothetical protein
MLTLVQLDYKSNFEENVEHTMIQKNNNSRERKVFKTFFFSAVDCVLDSILVSPAESASPLKPPVASQFTTVKKSRQGWVHHEPRGCSGDSRLPIQNQILILRRNAVSNLKPLVLLG